MFSYCKSLPKIPDINKWNTKNIKDSKGLFYGCSSLTTIPDISNWKFDNMDNLNKILSLNNSSSYENLNLSNISNTNYSLPTNEDEIIKKDIISYNNYIDNNIFKSSEKEELIE